MGADVTSCPALVAPTQVPALTHYAYRRVAAIESLGQGSEPAFKPNGLWVSVEEGGNGWAEYCRANDYGADRLAVVHDIVLAPDANLLTLTDPDGFDAFEKRYGTAFHRTPRPDYVHAIRWAEVAASHQGIVIAPYLWCRRLDGGLWYYGWDCASGCIWDASAISSIAARQIAPEAA